MRNFFDCEFIDTGNQIILLSIGIVKEDGETYYAEDYEAPRWMADMWVTKHVLPHLDHAKWSRTREPDEVPPSLKSRARIAKDIVNFVGPNPRFYSYVSPYDWVVLSQLYGPLASRPQGWPWGCIDLAPLAELAGIDPDEWLPPENAMPGWEHLPDGAHHAMPGALWAKLLWERIQQRAEDERDLAALGEGP